MSFLFPLTLFLGLLAPVIALLYLHRPRRRSVVVSSLRFWLAVLEREPHRRFLGKLRNPLSLLLQLLIFFLLVLALARPEWGLGASGQSTVIILDARVRMQAGDTFLLARNAALELIGRAGPDHEIALLANDGSPRILSPFSSDRRGLQEAVEALQPSDAGGGMSEALTLGRRLLAGRPAPRRLVLITDRPLSDGNDLSSEMDTVLVGTPRDNLGLTAFAHRRLPASPQSGEVFATLGNFSSNEVTAEVELALDGRVFDLKKITIPGGKETSFTTLLSQEMPGDAGSGKLIVRLTSEDALAADNIGRAALNPRHLRVLLLSTGNPFLENALKADRALEVEILDPSAWQPDMAGGFQAVIFDDWWPEDTTAADNPGGNFFFFGRSPWETESGETAISEVKVSDPDSPLLWQVDGGKFALRTIRPLEPPEGWRVTTPVETDQGPAVMTLERPGKSRVVATAFSVNSTTFPLRVGFPLFVHNVIHWLVDPSQGESASFAAGRVFVPAPDEHISSAPISAAEEPVPPASFSGEPQRLMHNGFYKIQPAAEGKSSERWIAVNTINREESDLRDAAANRNTFLLRRAGVSFRPWQWLALGALVLMSAEWILHHRRLTE